MAALERSLAATKKPAVSAKAASEKKPKRTRSAR
jgi:hypothetical protein